MRLRRLVRVLVLVLAAGCTALPATGPFEQAAPATTTADCCTGLQRYPKVLVDLIEPKANAKEAFTDDKRFRAPFLKGRPEAWAYILRHLAPMDILTTSDKGILRGQLMPGYFSHSLLYIGTEAQLRAEGLWDLPALRPYHAEIRGGAVFFEGIVPEVTFSKPETVFAADAVGVYRAPLSAEDKRVALDRALALHGKPFDWHFDSRTTDCFYCAEVIDVTLPQLRLPRRLAYGREVIPPDTFAQIALTDPARLHLVGYVYGTRHGVESAGPDVLAATLEKAWR
ncbi:hypothetical protein [Sagittula sp. S175]|uniref:hypothetical protein n=1 Tax=Sagittula sp. S175 TaxID=3415129 RepID=UPI003C7D6F5E